MNKPLPPLLVGIGILFILGACVPQPTAVVPSETATASPQPTSTQTVEWFPPTETPRPAPTRENTPTPPVQPNVGEVIFRDDFSSSEDWILPESEQGEINISGSEINVIINDPGTFLMGFREKPDLTNFFAQITANPSLCTGADEYGLLYKVLSGATFYRFSVTCNGQIRLEKIIGGSVFTLQPSMRSASVPAGGPRITTLEVLVNGQEMLLYIDGTLQFVVEDADIQVGSLGVYARSRGEKALTVSFSDLVVRELIPE